jgi:predicted nucleic acid-binding protein
MGPLDMLIAVHAKLLGLILAIEGNFKITGFEISSINNTNEFESVKTLKTENWV